MSIRAIVLSAVAILAAACAVSPPAPPVAAKPAAAAPATAAASSGRELALTNPGFEEAARAGEGCAAGWDCTMHDDPRSFRFFHAQGQGTRGYCIESVGREPWARVNQILMQEQIASVRGARVRLSLTVKLDGMTLGEAGPLIIARDGSGQIIKKADKLVGPKPGWQPLEVEMEVPAATLLLDVGVLFQRKSGLPTQSMGSICVDHVRLERVAASPGAV